MHSLYYFLSGFQFLEGHQAGMPLGNGTQNIKCKWLLGLGSPLLYHLTIANLFQKYYDFKAPKMNTL
jgi:hypothetical protein